MGEGEREGCGCDMGWGGERNNMAIRNTVTTAHLHVYTDESQLCMGKSGMEI